MPDGGPADLSQRLRAEDRRLLIEQIRLACWNILFLAIAFALGDVIFIGAASPTAHVLNLGVCGILVGALFAIRLPKLQQWAVPFALTLVAAVYFCTAAAAIVRHDATSTAFFAVIITLGIGAMFAWGVGPQLATVALASTAMAWSAYAVNGKLDALGHNAILAIATAMLLSVWVTYRRARFRFEMAR